MSKEKRQISVFRHWRSSQFAPLRPRIHTYFRAFSASTKLEFLSRVLAYYRDRIFRQRCAFCRYRWKKSKAGRRRRRRRKTRKTGGKDTEVAGNACRRGRRRSEDEARRRGGGRGRVRRKRTRTPTMRRRYATEYHYPDNGPAISSTACINLRVKGQDTRYLNK